jgi:glyoxylase-like metal-dependent hydrolase (beta-lactamase superfamily II)
LPDGSIETFVLGPLETNAYLIRSGGACWVVDPGGWCGPLRERLGEEGVGLEGVLLTHGHADHIAGIAELREAFGPLAVRCPAGDAAMLTDAAANLSGMMAQPIVVGPPTELVQPGQTLRTGSTQWAVLDTSGHTPGGVSYYCAEASVVVTGDALFAGSIGRTDIPGGSASRLLGNIRRRLLTLPGDTAVLPGHGPPSTIADELRDNPFFAPR